jgi:hypothetical protein
MPGRGVQETQNLKNWLLAIRRPAAFERSSVLRFRSHEWRNYNETTKNDRIAESD